MSYRSVHCGDGSLRAPGAQSRAVRRPPPPPCGLVTRERRRRFSPRGNLGDRPCADGGRRMCPRYPEPHAAGCVGPLATLSNFFRTMNRRAWFVRALKPGRHRQLPNRRLGSALRSSVPRRGTSAHVSQSKAGSGSGSARGRGLYGVWGGQESRVRAPTFFDQHVLCDR